MAKLCFSNFVVVIERLKFERQMRYADNTAVGKIFECLICSCKKLCMKEDHHF